MLRQRDDAIRAKEGLKLLAEGIYDLDVAAAVGAEAILAIGDEFRQLPVLETGAAMRVLEQAIAEMIRNGVDPAAEAFNVLRAELEKLRATDTAQALETIALKAQLLGENFDAMGARVALARKNFEDLVVAERDGAATMDEVTAAAGRLNAVLAEQKWDKAFQGMFLSVTDTFDKMVTGLIQGTLDIESAFKNLGQSLIANFARIVIHEVFDPTLKAAGTFVGQLTRMALGIGGGGGGAGQWVQGATGLMEWQAGPGGAGGGGPAGVGGAGGGGLFGGGIPGIQFLADIGGSFGAAQAGWEAFMTMFEGGAGLFESVGFGLDIFQQALPEAVAQLGQFASAVGAVYSLYSGISALAEGRTGAGIGQLGGMLIGGIVGSIFPVIGTLFGAAIGGFLGGTIGGLFDEDWEMIHKLRAQQRHRTALTALSETTGRLIEAPTTAALAESFRRPIIGTETTTGGVLLSMAQRAMTGDIKFEGDLTFTLPEATAQTIIGFLEKAGFTGEEFDSGRVNSITELIAATGQGDIQQGIEDWQTFMEGLAQFINIVTATQESLTELKDFDWEAVAGDSEKMGDAIVEGGLAIINAIKVAGTLGEAGFAAAADNIRKQVADIVTAFGPFDVVMGKVAEAITAAAIQDPRILMAVLDMSKFQRAGEDIQETTDRVAEALGGLAELMAKLRQATKSVDITTMSDDLAKAMKKTGEAIEETKTKLAEATDPSDILAYAQTLTGLTEAYYQMQIDMATALVEIVRTNVAAVVNTVQNIVSNADFLEQIGVDIRGAMTDMIGFAASLDVDLPSKMAAIGGAMDLFMVEFKQALKAPDLAAALGGLVAPGGDLLGTIQEAFTQAMQLTDPNAQVEALNGLLNMLGSGVQAIIQALAASGLSESQQKAILTPILDSIGPLGRQIYDALVTASREQARQAQLAQAELQQIMGNQAMNYQNFIALKLGEMTDAMQRTLNLLESAIRNLSERGFGNMAEDMNAVRATLDRILVAMTSAPSAQTGLVHVPSTGLYHLHEGEMVLNPEAAARMRATGMAGGLAQGGAMGFVRVGGDGETATAISEMANDIIAAIENMASMVVSALRNLREAGLEELGSDVRRASESGTEELGSTIESNIETMRNAIVGAIENLSALGFGDMVSILRSMDSTLSAILGVVGGVPAAQGGMHGVGHTGLAVLHEGEMVLNPRAAAVARGLGISNAMLEAGAVRAFQEGSKEPYDPRLVPDEEDQYIGGINVRTGESGWAQISLERQKQKPARLSPEAEAEVKAASLEYYKALTAQAKATNTATGAAEEATDAFLEAADAISNVARTLSQHADLLKEAGISLAGLADPMFAWSATLPTLASQMAAFSGAASLLEAELRQTEDAWGTLVRVGPHALNAVRDLTQAAVGLSDADPKAKLEGLTGAFDAIAGGIKMAQGAVSEQYDRMRQQAEEAGQAQEEALDRQREALDQQLDTLNDLVQSTEDWARVATSIADQLLELRTGPLGSPNPSERFAAARGAFDVAMAAFRAAPTAEGAADVQELASAVLEAASEFMTRPSPQYQELFAEITAALEDVQQVAESRGVSQEELLQQIAALEEQSRQLDTERNQIAEQTRAAIERLNADEKVALQAIANTFSAELKILVEEMQRVSVAAALQTTGQQGQTDVAVQSLARLGEISQASSYSAATIGAIAGAMGAAQEGAWRTHAGLYALHEGEMVLPAPVATTVRAGGGGGGGRGVAITIGTVNVTGSREGAREFFEELETLTERSIRYGKLRRVLQRETP
jgi:hypothetical protein